MMPFSIFHTPLLLFIFFFHFYIASLIFIADISSLSFSRLIDFSIIFSASFISRRHTLIDNTIVFAAALPTHFDAPPL